MGKYMQKVMKREKREMERECGDLPFGEYLSLPEDTKCRGTKLIILFRP